MIFQHFTCAVRRHTPSISWRSSDCAIYYTNASNVAILVSFVPIATAIIARIVLKDRSLSIPLVVGSLIAICGVAVVSVGSTIELQVHPLGDLMALIAMLSWGFYSILVDIVNARGVAPITAMRKSFAWSLVIMAPFALWGATECGAHSLDGVFGVTLAVEENAARFSSVGNWANFEATEATGSDMVTTVNYHRYAKQSSAELIAEGAIS